MTIKTSTLRPGLLVSLKTSLVGNVRYSKRVIESEHVVEGGAEKASWETERLISDPKEYEEGKKARSKARSLVNSVCAFSAFGLLCPESQAGELEKAIAAARAVADAFNDGAALSRVYVYVITGRIAPDDVEAVKAINSEVRDLLEEMKRGVETLDVKTIRDAASRAKSLGSMLSPDAGARIQIAIEAARAAAKKIVQAGETAATEIDAKAIRAITESRTAFLDLDAAVDVAMPAEKARGLDLAPTAREDLGYVAPKRAVELE